LEGLLTLLGQMEGLRSLAVSRTLHLECFLPMVPVVVLLPEATESFLEWSS
jgi:hypothetical protein